MPPALPFGPGDETFAAPCPSVPGDETFAVPVLPSPFRPFPSLSSFPPVLNTGLTFLDQASSIGICSSPSRKFGMPRHVRTWAVILVAAAVTGVPPCGLVLPLGLTRANASRSERPLTARAARVPGPASPRARASNTAMIEPPHPTQPFPERVGHVAVDTHSDRAGALCDDLLELPRPPLRC